MITNPIIPIWVMAIICVALLALKRKGIAAYIRQIIIVLLLFAINLRPMVEGEAKNIDETSLNVHVLFAIDDTISMLADDCNGKQRLEAVKKDCAHIIEELDGARFSVLSFHNKATIVSPFTDNSEHIINCIDAMYPLEDLYARGTSLNTPKELMISTLKQLKDQDGKVYLFFISDGEITDKTSSLEKFTELKDMIDGGAVLGYGTTKGGNMQYFSSYTGKIEIITDSYGKPGVSRLDENNLKSIASDAGIEYIHMENSKDADNIINSIKSGATTSKKENSNSDDLENAEDVYFYFVIPLVLLLAFEVVIMIRRK